ncbi:CRISPR-associated helicase Cas3' [Halostreptopolyspora alba]|uniref:CRISPR-associated helicase Cas3' n=1 Tax=Halostreptopolyspora alba TaxID=2487137 RepID=UPI0026C5F68A
MRNNVPVDAAGPPEGIDFSLWGKSEGLPPGVRYPLACHLLDAAAAAEALWRDHVSPGVHETIAHGLDTTVDHAGTLIRHWAGLHDIGKITHGFQGQDATAPIRGYPAAEHRKAHDHVAAEWLQCALPEYGYPKDGRRPPTLMVAQLLGGHHGRFHQHVSVSSSAPLRALGYPDDAWETQRRLHLAAVTELLGHPAAPDQIDGTAAALVCGVVIQADWLVSQLSFIGRQLAGGLPATPGDLPRHLHRAREKVPALLGEAGLGRPAPRTGSFTAAFPSIDTPNGLQRSLAEHLPRLCEGPGLLLVTAPMGEGKTEAALYAAEVMGRAAGRCGLYVALPTMATADQMFTRVTTYLRRRNATPSTTTLLHGMAWLNPHYLSQQDTAPAEEQLPPDNPGSAEFRRLVEVSEWLRGRKRGLFADYAVGTIDQALMAALRSRHNVVRMLGLAGKTVVIDEVHAADSYMLALVTRLLNWLGRLQVPVILLSATLHHRTARTLIEAYLKGAGRRRNAAPIPTVAYPGWVYASAQSPHPVTVNPEPLETTQRKPLALHPREVSLTGDDTTALDRAIQEELAKLVEQGGCAAVIRTTVAEAQHTFHRIAEWSARHARATGTEPPEMYLLHARFPAQQRERVTEDIVHRLGANGAPNGQRPRSAILVATAIIEQSIDIDVDLMVSDLAPIHLLLQRSGRCWRHEHRGILARPAWATEPRLVVLAPHRTDAEDALPRGWSHIHHPSLLLRTHNLLRRWANQPVRVPEDVQELVDGMIDDTDLNPDNPHQDLDREATDLAYRSLGENAAIPPPGRATRDLYRLTDHDIDEAQVATRFGADTTRVVCCYSDSHGHRWLDEALSEELPETGELAHGGFSTGQVRAVLSRSLPVPGRWLEDHAEQAAPPETWLTSPHLCQIRLLVHRVGPDGSVHGPQLGGRRMYLDPRLGLVVEP